MFKLNLDHIQQFRSFHESIRRGYSDQAQLNELGAQMLLALTDGNDDVLEKLADLLASACPTPTDLGQLAQDTERLSQKLWQQYDAAGGESSND